MWSAFRSRAAVLLIALAAVVSALSCHAGYVIDQGVDFFGLMHRRVPIEEARSSSDVPERDRQKLKVVERARAFAGNRLGIEVSEQYTSYVHVDREAVSWNITATPWNRVDPIVWSFPVVGSFPYIGFFEKRDAIAFRDELIAEGRDVHMRPVSAFSTIGWFSDPIYSTMLDQPEPLLVETVIHELLHGAVFFENAVTLSESAASEIGRRATISYLRQRYGPDASIVSWTQNYYRDLDRIRSFFRSLRERLHSLYKSDLSKRRMRTEKRQIFRRARRSFADLTEKLSTDGWKGWLSDDWNNAFVAARAVYSRHTDLIRRLWKTAFRKDLPATIRFLQSISGSSKPVERIRSRIKRQETKTSASF